MIISDSEEHHKEQILDVHAKLASLCRRLEGQHKCPKTVIDNAVQEVRNLSQAVDVSINIENISTDRNCQKCQILSRMKDDHYRFLGAVVIAFISHSSLPRH